VSRTEAALVVAVGALGLFVAVQVAGRPLQNTHHATAAAAAAGTAAVQQEAALSPRVADARVIVMRSGSVEPVRDADDTRQRIAASTTSYMPDMLADLNGSLVRWPDLRERGLRIWVQSVTAVRDWDLRYAQMARDAFADWDGDGLPMRLDFVLDSATSDVHIVWLDHFAPEMGTRVGTTNRTNDQNGWIVAADIVVAVHDSTGRTIPPAALAGIVRHEAGHALGLGHSRDPKTKMFPVEMTGDITPADRATLRLLYELPPGPVR
jgi:hypothetical protein